MAKNCHIHHYACHCDRCILCLGLHCLECGASVTKTKPMQCHIPKGKQTLIDAFLDEQEALNQAKKHSNITYH